MLDPDVGELPELLTGDGPTWGESAVAVGTRAEVDGPTTFVLSTESDAVSGLELRSSGVLETAGRLAIVTVEFEEILGLDVEPGRVNIAIWTDDPNAPGRIHVIVNMNE